MTTVSLVAVALGGVLLTVATMWLAPVVLTRGRWQLHHPRLALACWFGAFAAGSVLAVAAVAATVAIAATSALASGGAAPLDPGVAITVVVALWLGSGGVIAVVAALGGSAKDGREGGLTAVPIALSRQRLDSFTLVRFAAAEPVAIAVPGRGAEIMISTGLEQTLSESQVRAVIAHEYAHLRQRHGAAMRIARLNELWLPGRLRTGRAFHRATTLLIELAADDAAARQVGAAHLANALARIGAATGNESMQIRAHRLTAKRWPRAHRRRVPVPVQRAVFASSVR